MYKNTDQKGIEITDMNIQIFGTKKCNDTKKAERFFKERGIRYQFIDMKDKGMSKGEFISVAQANGGLENMINQDFKDKDLLALIKYIAEEDKLGIFTWISPRISRWRCLIRSGRTMKRK